MNKIFTAAAVLASATALSAPAFAGSLSDPVVDTTPIAPVPAPVYAGGDWTGAYVGAQLGYGDISGDDDLDGIDGDGTLYGVHAGYNYDFGTFVLGGELDYDGADIEVSGNGISADVDEIYRAKIKGGYDLGRTLLYATGGYAKADTSVGDTDGGFYGIGASYMVSDQFILGAELLRHEFSDLDDVDGFDTNANTLTVRGSYKF